MEFRRNLSRCLESQVLEDRSKGVKSFDLAYKLCLYFLSSIVDNTID